MENRLLYAKEALSYAPKLFTLIDRNKFSPSYGCLDREFWHYKTADFPCGMSQEAVLSLALLYQFPFPDSIYYKNERVRDIALAAINFAMRCSHTDGTCDEYYPFERAQGAMVFSLYACTEAYLILGEKNPSFENFFKKRAQWLMNNSEVGILANHEAMAALALLNVSLITQDEHYKIGSQKRLKRVLSLQSLEGWFQEYEGCDPGYVSWTIDSLAKYFKKTGDSQLLNPLQKAIEFISYFIHPDGSFGGEYGSRNSYNFFVHGLEILGPHFPIATQICDIFFEGIRNNKRAHLDDNRSFSHHMGNFLQAYLDFNESRQGILIRNDFEKYFKEAGIYIAQKGNYYAIISLKKGGVVKLFKDHKNIYNDAGFIGQLNNHRTAVSHLFSKKEIKARVASPSPREGSQQYSEISVKGHFNEVKYPYMSHFKFIVFRLGLLPAFISPLYSVFLRKILQKMLILNKKNLPIEFQRQFTFEEGLNIVDTIRLKGPLYFKQLAIGSDHTSIYTAISNCFQESVLSPWIDLNPLLNELREKKEITFRRKVQ